MFTRNIIVEKPVLFDVYAKELPHINIMHYIMHYSTAFVGRIFVSQVVKHGFFYSSFTYFSFTWYNFKQIHTHISVSHMHEMVPFSGNVNLHILVKFFFTCRGTSVLLISTMMLTLIMKLVIYLEPLLTRATSLYLLILVRIKIGNTLFSNTHNLFYIWCKVFDFFFFLFLEISLFNKTYLSSKIFVINPSIHELFYLSDHWVFYFPCI